MENYQDSSNDKDAKLKRSFESYQSVDETAEKKKKEKEKEKEEKAKQKRAQQQKTEQAKRSDEKPADENWLGEKKPVERKSVPSLLGELLGEERPDTEERPTADTTKRAKLEHATTATPEATEPDPETIKLTELSPAEQREAAIAYVTEREARLAAEVAQTEQAQDIATAKEVTANQSFLRRLRTKLLGEQEDRPTNELLDEAANETCSELEDAVVAEEESTSESEPTELDQTDSTPEDNYSDNSSESERLTSSNEGPISIDQEDTWSQQPINSVITASPPVNLRAGGGGSGGIVGGAGVSSFGGGDGGGPVTPDTFDNLPNRPNGGELATTATTVARETVGYVERGARRAAGAGEFLLGAFVGYLFGRRRGRINSEAEHEPVKKQLEQKVKKLQSDIEAREAQVRSAARQEFPEATLDPRSASSRAEASNPVTKQEAKTTNPQESKPNAIQEASKNKEKPTSFDSKESIAPAAAAGLEAVLSKRSEAPEAITTPKGAQEQAENIAARFVEKESIATMPLTQVLEQAKQIAYHGETLRDMYETNKIDEKMLRETLKAFQGGERYERHLERGLRQLQEAAVSVETLEQERSFNEHPSQKLDQSTESIQLATSSRSQNTIPTSQTLFQDAGSDYEEGSTKGITPMRQASIGALIGIIFVVVIILFFGLR